MAWAFTKYRVDYHSQEIEAKTVGGGGTSLSLSLGGFSAPLSIAFNLLD